MQLIDILKKQLAELNSIRQETEYPRSFDILNFEDPDANSRLKQKFYRWRKNTSEIIEKRISKEEEKNFKKSCPSKKQLEEEMSNCAAYLEVLIDQIQKKSDFFKSAQKSNIPASSYNQIAIINNMHKEVAKIAKNRIKNGEYKSIIQDVCISLNNYVRKKAGIHDADGTELMEKAFASNDPKIKLADGKVGEKKFKEEQKGFMFLFSGAMKTIRNKAAHNHQLYTINSLQDALEILGFFSFLFKIIDSQKDK